MSTLSYVLTRAFGFICRLGILSMAVAWLSTISYEYGKDEPFLAAGPSSPFYDSPLVGHVANVRMVVGEGRFYSDCTLLDEEGNKLLLARYDRSGGLWIQLGDVFPVRPSCVASPDGKFHLDLLAGEDRYRLRVRPDETGGVVIFKGTEKEIRGLGVDENGEFVEDAEQIELGGSRHPSAGNQAAEASSGVTRTATPSSNASRAETRATADDPARSSVSRTESP